MIPLDIVPEYFAQELFSEQIPEIFGGIEKSGEIAPILHPFSMQRSGEGALGSREDQQAPLGTTIRKNRSAHLPSGGFECMIACEVELAIQEPPCNPSN